MWYKHLTEKPQLSIIVPTLNEESSLYLLLNSAKNQPVSFETLIVDGGSKDKTHLLADKYHAQLIVLQGYGEFISRNIGAKNAKSQLLFFTSADIVFPKELLNKVTEKFGKDPDLIALTGPGYPFDGSFLGRMEYIVYNFARYLSNRFPKPFKRFSTSTNFLVVRKDCFEMAGGFLTDDVNADGLMGKKLLDLGKVAFFLDTFVYLSTRRLQTMGFVAFNKHYLYVMENFLFSTSDTDLMKALKRNSRSKHRKMREIQKYETNYIGKESRA
jgi:glycosyltransferase involved in cell wall biosynthesis